jgi:hypothetical protein
MPHLTERELNIVRVALAQFAGRESYEGFPATAAVAMAVLEKLGGRSDA